MSLFSSFLTDTSRLLDQPANPRLQGMIDSVVSSTNRSTPRPQSNLENIASGRYVIPPDETYSARYSSGTSTYYYYYDEAIRNSTANALAMRRDTAISEPLDHRKMACVSQNWYLKPDDPDDADQQAVCDDLESVLENASMFKQFLLNLLEDIYFGKAGCQSKFGYEMIKGKKRLTVIDHAPIMGDKIQYHYNGTPGILIRGGSPYLEQPEYAKNIDRSTLGPALFLNDPWLRDQFVISKFRTSDFDYIWEGDKALAVHGIGMRDSLYWAWNLRTEVWTWILDALQRVSANGMTLGFFEYGNAEAEKQMMAVMKQLVKDNYAVVGVDKGTIPQNMIHNIPVSAVGYEIMLNLVKYLDDFIRRAFLGQELTSTSRSSGMGSETANIQKSIFDHIVGYDSDRIGEVISRQLLKILLKYNTWTYKKQEVYGDQLPFSIRFIFEHQDDEDAKPADTAKTLHEMGIDLDKEDLRDKTGFAAPQDRESLLAGKSQEEPASPMATQGGGVPVPPNGQAAQRPTFPANGMAPGKTGKNLGRIDQMEMFSGPPDEKRDQDGKWTTGGASGVKEKTQTSVKGNLHDINDHIKSVFGRRIDREAISSMAGTPAGSHSEISMSGNSIKVSWKSDFGSAERSIRRDDNGKVVMDNISFNVDEKSRGHGLGANVFGQQIDAAKAMGVSKIQTIAIRDADSIGYKVWPLFGYDGDIPNSINPPGGERRVSELMKTSEGREWWSKNGDTIELDFDLSPGSYSMKTWESYKRSKKGRK